MSDQERTLVILGTMSDPHVERVALELSRYANTRVTVIDYHEISRISLDVDRSGHVVFRVNGRQLPENYLVWDRNKILAGTELYIRGDDEASTGYAAQEWRALYTLLSGLNSERAVNSLSSKRCMIKPYQQTLAASVGFRVPATLVTNDKASAIAFHRRSANGIILKSLSAAKIKPAGEGEYIPYNVMTMRIAEDELQSADIEEIAYCPHFFQEEIRKAYELRIVVVGDRIFPFKVDSQARKSSEIDWRKGMEMIDFGLCTIGEDMTKKIRRFMSKMGFFTGSIDLVVGQDETVWFLECNQDGAWGWLDDIVSGDIARGFAEEFSRRLDSLAADRTRSQASTQAALDHCGV